MRVFFFGWGRAGILTFTTWRPLGADMLRYLAGKDEAEEDGDGELAATVEIYMYAMVKILLVLVSIFSAAS